MVLWRYDCGSGGSGTGRLDVAIQKLRCAATGENTEAVMVTTSTAVRTKDDVGQPNDWTEPSQEPTQVRIARNLRASPHLLLS